MAAMPSFSNINDQNTWEDNLNARPESSEKSPNSSRRELLGLKCLK